MFKGGVFFLIAQLVFLANLQAADGNDDRELLFRSNFVDNPGLKGWYDVYKGCCNNRDVDTPKAEWYHVQTENGETFLKTGGTSLGITSLLTPPLLVDDSVAEIELRVTLRAPADGRAKSVALTSRNYPSGSDGGPFWKGHKDSGVMAQGFHRDCIDIRHVNASYIAAQKAGRQVLMYAFRPPFNMLTRTGKEWVTWRLVYRHCEKELLFFRDSDEAVPFITQRNVDLSGVLLRSVWIGALNTEYLNIEVYRKNAPKNRP